MLSCTTATAATRSCLSGAFFDDIPSKKQMEAFKTNFGKRPDVVMIFIDWENYIAEPIINDIYANGSTLLITWEPWRAINKQAINYDDLLNGKWDNYIRTFASKLNAINHPVFLRFAHEMNGDWYPWSGAKIGTQKYIAIYRYVKNIFDTMNIPNVRWIFSINAEDVPSAKDNYFLRYYPGDGYVDYIGIDGYNWGTTRAWSRWMSFQDIFEKRYREILATLNKPVMITEFSSTSQGGDKTLWIKNAMQTIKQMKTVKAFILFNVDKETDWRFKNNTPWQKELKKQLKDPYFNKDSL